MASRKPNNSPMRRRSGEIDRRPRLSINFLTHIGSSSTISTTVYEGDDDDVYLKITHQTNLTQLFDSLFNLYRNKNSQK